MLPSWDHHEPPVCQVIGGSDNAALLRVVGAIVWDEMGNASRADVEAVGALLRELRGSERPFGGVYLIGLDGFCVRARTFPGVGARLPSALEFALSHTPSSFSVCVEGGGHFVQVISLRLV